MFGRAAYQVMKRYNVMKRDEETRRVRGLLRIGFALNEMVC